MASVEEPHSVNTKEKGSTVIVTLVIPGLTVTYFSRQPRNFTVDPKFSERSYEVMVKIRNKNEERLVQHRIKRLPGEIVPMNCSLEYKKDQIILKLAKRNQESWAIALSQSGLEQG